MNDEELFRRIGTLSAPPLPPAFADRVHRRARAAYELGPRAPSRLVAAVTATAVLSAVAIYLTWAALFLGALARGV